MTGLHPESPFNLWAGFIEAFAIIGPEHQGLLMFLCWDGGVGAGEWILEKSSLSQNRLATKTACIRIALFFGWGFAGCDRWGWYPRVSPGGKPGCAGPSDRGCDSRSEARRPAESTGYFNRAGI